MLYQEKSGTEGMGIRRKDGSQLARTRFSNANLAFWPNAFLRSQTTMLLGRTKSANFVRPKRGRLSFWILNVNFRNTNYNLTRFVGKNLGAATLSNFGLITCTNGITCITCTNDSQRYYLYYLHERFPLFIIDQTLPTVQTVLGRFLVKTFWQYHCGSYGEISVANNAFHCAN